MTVDLELTLETDVHHVHHGNEITVQPHCGHYHLQEVPFDARICVVLVAE